MATALQIFDALEEITSDLKPGSEFQLHSSHRAELFQLTEANLLSRHLSKTRTEEILNGIWHQDIEPLSRSLGVKLSFSDDAPRIVN
jgi:hypothetical protein